jgi:hypothetical protein
MQMLRVVGGVVSSVSHEGLPLSLAAVWCVPERTYIVGGAGLFSVRLLGQRWQEDRTQPLLYVSGIRGQALNDIVLCGGYGHLSHFNGRNWRHYAGSEIPYLDGNLNEVHIRVNFTVAVGWLVQGKAIAVRGWRQ